MPSYSVIIPTFNSSLRVEETIISVLKQSVSALEIILVDDCSDDLFALKEICNKFPKIKLIEKSVKSNAADSRNIGWSEAKGDYIFFLDSDDLWMPYHAEEYLNIFTENKAVECVFGSFYTRVAKNAKLIPNSLNDFNENLYGYIFEEGNDFRSSTVSVKNKIFNSVRFDSTAQKHQDWDFYLSLTKMNRSMVIHKKPSVVINCFGSFRMSGKNNLEATFNFLDKWWNTLTLASKSFILFQIVKAAILNSNAYELSLIKERYLSHIKSTQSKKLKYIVLLASINFHFSSLLLFFLYKVKR